MDPGDVLGDRFAIEALAGTGGMGAVYRARDRASGETVALKVLLRSSDTRRFQQEAQVLSEIRDPAVVRYVAHGTDDGKQWLAMEWLEGVDLHDRLGARGPLTIAETIVLGRCIATGLGAAHARGIVHRDVKPTNVLLEHGDPARARILDFGIARIGEGRTHTLTGVLLGTPGYLAPEQARGDAHVDARADVFALGSVLYEAMTGRPTFAGGSIMAVLAKILFEPAPRLRDAIPDVPERLDALLARMLEKDPEKRPRDGSEVAAELAAIDPATRSIETWEDESIGHAERSLASVIVAVRGLEGRVVDRITEEEQARLRPIAERFGARIEPLVDGSVAALISGAKVASDQAIAAARCALAIHAAIPTRSIGVATAAAVLGLQPQLGAIIGRAAERAGAGRGIQLDDVTTGLLADRFVVEPVPSGSVLVRERTSTIPPARRCVGRDHEIGVIEGLFARSVEEPSAQAVLLVGEAGIGKSSLARAAADAIRARRPDTEVWVARGDPMHEGAAYAALATALRGAVGEGTPGELARARGIDPGVAGVIDALLGGARMPEGAGALADRAIDAVAQILARSAGPVLFVVEDVHACDVATVEAIDALLRRLAGSPLFVLATARADVDDRFPKLWADRPRTRLQLGALGKKAAAALARERLGEGARGGVIDAIVAESEGHPFLLEELARAARSGSRRTPGTVQAVLHARLDALPAPLRRVLRAASVLGDAIGPDGVRAIAGGRGTADALAQLEREEILVQAGERWSFRHALLRETAYAMLTDEDRALAHRLAAQWLERRGDARAAVLAEHWARAGERDHAARWIARAAGEALAANDLAGALAHCERGMASRPQGELRGEILRVSAEALVWQGRITEAHDVAGRAMAALPRGSRAWCAAASVLGTAQGRLGRTDDLVALTQEVCAIEPDEQSAQVLAGALARMSMHLFFSAQFEVARAGIARLAELDARFGASDPSIGARLAQSRAVEARYDGDVVGHQVWTERALAGFEAMGDRRTACVLRSNLGDGWKSLGRWAEAEASMRATLESALELGIGAVVAPVRLNLGIALAKSGRADEALPLLEEAVASSGRSGDRRFEAAGRIFLADAHRARGDLDAARAEIDTALTLLEPRSPYRSLAYAVDSAIRRSVGDVAGALSSANESVAELDVIGHAEEGELQAHLALAEALEMAGDRVGAASAIRDARARLDQAMSKIADDALRASFVSGVPEHRRIVELSRAWGIG